MRLLLLLTTPFFFFSLPSSADLFSTSTECIPPNEVISARELMKKMETAVTAEGCDVYSTDLLDIIADSGFSFADGYEGPTAFVKMISNSSPFSMEPEILAIRADKPLCIQRPEPNIELVVYRTEFSRGGPLEFLLNSTETQVYQIAIQFTDGVLNLVEESLMVDRGGLWGNDRIPRTFKCGSYTNQAQNPTP